MKTISILFGLLLINTLVYASSNPLNPSQDKPPRLFVSHYTESVDTTDDYGWDGYDGDGVDQVSLKAYTTGHHDHTWDDGKGGNGTDMGHTTSVWHYHSTTNNGDGGCTTTMTWPGPDLGDGTQHSAGDCNWEEMDTNGPCGSPVIVQERCAIKAPPIKTKWGPTEDDYYGLTDYGWENLTFNRSANAVMKLQTGGKAKSKLQNLFKLHGSATQIIITNEPGPSYGYIEVPVPKANITILGQPLNSNGDIYKILSDNDEQVVTPEVKGVDYYTFDESEEKYYSYFTVFVSQPYPGTTYYVSETAGHAFWQFSTDAPDDALQHIDPNLTDFLFSNWGFYPNGADCGLAGQLANDNTHGYSVKRVFYIGFNDLISGLQFTRGLNNSPPEYCLAVEGYSCVGAARDAGHSAGVALPYRWTPQNFGASIVLKYPGPLVDDTPRYSH